jgi:hypothetical protein
VMCDDIESIGDYLDNLRGQIHVKLVRLAGTGNSDTLQRVCLAIGLRVADPYNLQSIIASPPARASRSTQDMLATVDTLFAEEIEELHNVIADAQEDPAWHASVEDGKRHGEIPTDKDPLQAIAEMILMLFLGFDEENAD